MTHRKVLKKQERSAVNDTDPIKSKQARPFPGLLANDAAGSCSSWLRNFSDHCFLHQVRIDCFSVDPMLSLL